MDIAEAAVGKTPDIVADKAAAVGKVAADIEPAAPAVVLGDNNSAQLAYLIFDSLDLNLLDSDWYFRSDCSHHYQNYMSSD